MLVSRRIRLEKGAAEPDDNCKSLSKFISATHLQGRCTYIIVCLVVLKSGSWERFLLSEAPLLS